MDELEFRRRIYADPDTLDPEVIKAAEADPDKQAFRDHIRQMNNELKQAAKIPVPEGLAHKLIWQQATDDFNARRKTQRWYTALAASIALVIGVMSTLWLVQRPPSLETQALAHVTHLNQELPENRYSVNIEQVNAKLASFGGRLVSTLGNIQVANFCHLQSVRSLHLILDTEQGPMSVFILPSEKANQAPEQFGNNNFQGTRFDLQRASILVVGDKNADLNPLSERVRKSIRFSA
ncbi:DUF3379 family protein [Alteromonas lipotrueiana]|uniref:DUF3379 family protein n=1 Tax=Alteromonas lipotrueiana TaxID=2803815 RepID=UPI001C47365A|nr:DUF3379 family protein [Alteromonas lipotrueiana]